MQEKRNGKSSLGIFPVSRWAFPIFDLVFCRKLDLATILNLAYRVLFVFVRNIIFGTYFTILLFMKIYNYK